MEVTHSCSEFCLPSYKMVTSQSPSPRGCINWNNSPSTAVQSIHCFLPLVHFPIEASLVACRSAVFSCPTQAMSGAQGKQYLILLLLHWRLYLFSLWAPILSSDPLWDASLTFLLPLFLMLLQFHCLNSKSQRGCVSAAYHSTMFPYVSQYLMYKWCH